MLIKELIRKNRSYRRFYQEEKISRETVLELIDYARLSASGGNKQPLRYIVSTEQETNNEIFSALVWAGYLTDWPGPDEGERPSAYITIVHQKGDAIIGGVDHGIAAQSILLGAVEKGLGGCIIATIKREQLRQVFNLSEDYEILLVIALGKPKETVVIDEIEAGQDIKYWREENRVHHVPKRKLKDIVIE